jgi:hypothetical protein
MVKVFVNQIFPLADAAAAMDYRLTTTAPGEVVLSITPQ